ncbi:MAG: hypothetical protein JJ992_23260, partial [Planctomycetes bacterium]|nr:hypothetical protein [Planctomycetota bacterium]
DAFGQEIENSDEAGILQLLEDNLLPLLTEFPFASITFTHVDENTTVFGGRDLNTFSLPAGQGSAKQAYQGRLYAGSGRRALSEVFLNPANIQSMLGLELPPVLVTNTLEYGFDPLVDGIKLVTNLARGKLLPGSASINVNLGANPDPRAPIQATGIVPGNLRNIDNVTVSAGVNAVWGSNFGQNALNAVLSRVPGVKDSYSQQQQITSAKSFLEQGIDLGTNVLTIEGFSPLDLVGPLGALGGPVVESLLGLLSLEESAPTLAPGLHLLGGGTGSDTYRVAATVWGVGAALELPDVPLNPDAQDPSAFDYIPEFYDTLDFSEVQQDLDFVIMEVNSANYHDFQSLFDDIAVSAGIGVSPGELALGMQFVLVTDGLFNKNPQEQPAFISEKSLKTLGQIFPDANFNGNIFIATDIENIIGGSGVNTFHFVNGAGLKGTISGDQTVLDYSRFQSANQYARDPSKTGVTVDFGATEYNVYEATGRLVDTFFSDLVPLNWQFGSATGVEGNRFGNIPFVNEAFGSLTQGNFAITGGLKVQGTQYSDRLTGNNDDNIFNLASSNANYILYQDRILRFGDQVDGRLGEDTISYDGYDLPVTVVLPESSSQEIYLTDLAAKFELTYKGKNTAELDAAEIFADKFRDSAEAIKRALLDLGNTGDIEVVGMGRPEEPWKVLFLDDNSTDAISSPSSTVVPGDRAPAARHGVPRRRA